VPRGPKRCLRRACRRRLTASASDRHASRKRAGPAWYDRRHNVIEINADFRGLRDIIDRWDRRYRNVPGAIAAIENLIGAWWRQALEEKVLGILALKPGPSRRLPRRAG